MQFTNVTHKNLNVEFSKRTGKVICIAESQNMTQILYHTENLDQRNIFIITSEQQFSQVQLFIHSTNTSIKLEPVINISSKLDFPL